MGLINFQPNPKIPPIGFFEPISVDPKDMMTDVEFLLGILKKLNIVIAQTNQNTEFINNYSGKIEEIETEVNNLKDEMINFENEINNEINTRFANITLELKAMIATTLNQANAYTDLVAQSLETEIQNISVGQIMVYDPTTGTTNSLQTVIDNLFDSTRQNALTATEYDALELTATNYDAYELTASAYDRNGKTLLTS
jgi:hypothetical protein